MADRLLIAGGTGLLTIVACLTSAMVFAQPKPALPEGFHPAKWLDTAPTNCERTLKTATFTPAKSYLLREHLGSS